MLLARCGDDDRFYEQLAFAYVSVCEDTRLFVWICMYLVSVQKNNSKVQIVCRMRAERNRKVSVFLLNIFFLILFFFFLRFFFLFLKSMKSCERFCVNGILF